jgi:hypothetical protein
MEYRLDICVDEHVREGSLRMKAKLMFYEIETFLPFSTNLPACKQSVKAIRRSSLQLSASVTEHLILHSCTAFLLSEIL